MRFEVQSLLASLLAIRALAACTVAPHEVNADQRTASPTLRQESTESSAAASHGATGIFPDPEDVAVEISVDEGCGTLAHEVSPAGTSYTTLFSSGVLVQDHASTQALVCTLVVRYRFPAGWAFDAPQTIVRGFARADEGASMRLRVSTSWEQAEVTTSRTFAASSGDDYVLAIDDVQAARAGGVTCGDSSARFEVKLEAHAAGSGSAVLYVDAVDGRVTWRRCE